MIQIFNELQTETANLKFIKTIEGENTQHYYYEFEGNFEENITLEDFLDSLSEEEQRDALVHLSLLWAEKQKH